MYVLQGTMGNKRIMKVWTSMPTPKELEYYKGLYTGYTWSKVMY